MREDQEGGFEGPMISIGSSSAGQQISSGWLSQTRTETGAEAEAEAETEFLIDGKDAALLSLYIHSPCEMTILWRCVHGTPM